MATLPLVNANNAQLRRRLKNYLIFSLKITCWELSPQSLVKKARAFLRSVAALTATHPEA